MIAALYVDPKGCYSGLDGVEVPPEFRDVLLGIARSVNRPRILDGSNASNSSKG